MVTPNISLPNNYWYKDSKNYLTLESDKGLKATLYLVNYAKLGTKHEDQVMAIKVLEIAAAKGITNEQKKTLQGPNLQIGLENLILSVSRHLAQFDSGL